MRGPRGPRKTLSDAYSAIIGIPEWTVCLIIHNTEPLQRITDFSHSAIGMPTNRHNIAALGSVRTPLSIRGDSLIVKLGFQFKHI